MSALQNSMFTTQNMTRVISLQLLILSYTGIIWTHYWMLWHFSSNSSYCPSVPTKISSGVMFQPDSTICAVKITVKIRYFSSVCQSVEISITLQHYSSIHPYPDRVKRKAPLHAAELMGPP